jgi:hypothetical protein
MLIRDVRTAKEDLAQKRAELAAERTRLREGLAELCNLRTTGTTFKAASEQGSR